MRMKVVVMLGHVHGDTAWHFDFDFSEAMPTGTTVNADEILCTRRV